MKKIILMMALFAAPLAKSETLSCSLFQKKNSSSHLMNFKIDRDLDADLEFAVVSFEAERPEIVHYKKEVVRRFTDWGGTGLITKHTYQQPQRPYQDQYVIEISERIGGHQFEETATRKGSYSKGGVLYANVECRIVDTTTHPPESVDSCILDCGRPCMERPVFCGKW